jgi:hypothetical protein
MTSPELSHVKFGRRGFAYSVLRLLERTSLRAADVVIATNESTRRLAIERGGVEPERIWIVRSGPGEERLRAVPTK